MRGYVSRSTPPRPFFSASAQVTPCWASDAQDVPEEGSMLCEKFGIVWMPAHNLRRKSFRLVGLQVTTA